MTDATLNIASDDELRRRAANGDERALAEMARRSASTRHLRLCAEQGDESAVVELACRLFNAGGFLDEANEKRLAA